MKELLIISLLGIVVLAVDVFNARKAVFPVIVIGLLGLIVSCVLDWGHNENPMNNNMLLMDNFSLGFTAVLSFIALCWFIITSDAFGTDSRRTDLYALAIFSLCGALLLTAYTNLVMLFLGIEIMSIPLYVLAASRKGDVKSNEAGFKYFFLGSLASAILLFGISLVYGATGTFDLPTLTATISGMSAAPMLLKVGVTMIFVGFAFKVSSAPFHFWTPDVYQGAPTPITAFMSTIVKGAAFAALLRLFSGAFLPLTKEMGSAIAIISGLSLLLANLTATAQTNSKRLLAYSSISHAGFMLAIVLTATSTSPKLMLFYVLTYSIASLTSFTILHHVASYQEGNEDTSAFKGLVKRNPIMAGAMTLSLLSMAGIPPLSGFMAKYLVISNTMESGYLWLVIIMILTSVVSVYYYLKIIIAMFTPMENAGRIVVSRTQEILFMLFSLLLVGLFFGIGLLDFIY